MIIKIKSSVAPPSEGLHQAILAAIVDLPDEKSFDDEDKMRQVIRFVWLIDEVDTNGKNRIVFQKMTKSFHEKATLHNVLLKLTGHAPNAKEDFNTEKYLGLNAGLVLKHSKDGQYANVETILKADPRNPVIMPEGWDVPKRRDGETVDVYNPYGETTTATDDEYEEEAL